MSQAYALSTFDNPWNPFTQFDEWFQFDTEKGYNSCSLLARVAKISLSLGEDENLRIISDAIDEIIANDELDVYIKIPKEPPDTSG